MRGDTREWDREERKGARDKRKIERGQTEETVSYKAFRDTHHNTRDVIRSRQPERERERRDGDSERRGRNSEKSESRDKRKSGRRGEEGQ